MKRQRGRGVAFSPQGRKGDPLRLVSVPSVGGEVERPLWDPCRHGESDVQVSAYGQYSTQDVLNCGVRSLNIQGEGSVWTPVVREGAMEQEISIWMLTYRIRAG